MSSKNIDVTADQVRSALDSVDDPHVPSSLANMGMLGGVEVDDGRVQVRLRIPCMACPGVGMLRERVESAISGLPGVQSVEMIEDWADPWDRTLVAPGTRSMMAAHGIQL